VRATLFLGVAASVVANILHALDNPVSQTIAAWPPLALLLTVELISRVPVHRRSLAFVRLVATATIAGIAAWVSYWHMAGVAARYGETGASPYLLPLSVDGLIVVASICLVELGGRISTLEAGATATAPAARAAEESSPADPARRAPAPRSTATAAAPRSTATAAAPRNTATAAALAEAAAALPRAVLPGTRDAEVSAFAPTLTRRASRAAGRVTAAEPAARPAVQSATQSAARPAAKAGATKAGTVKPAARARRSPAETIAAAVKIKSGRPDISEADLAAELGISASRWRTIRREAGSDDDLILAA
jgi:hypothetical protein